MLARFERLLEQAVEGSLRRVFPTTVQPVQLAKAAARAMEHGEVIGVRGLEVPNHYALWLAPLDLERFAGYGGALAEQVRDYLADYARERGLHTLAGLTVELREDHTVRPGSVRAEARFVNLAPAVERDLQTAVEGTRRLRLADLASAGSTALASSSTRMYLDDGGDLRHMLEPQIGIVRLGRAADNDVVIANTRVSRYHVQLRWVESSWLVYDLESTNGTWLDDGRVLPKKPRGLMPGARLRLGDHELMVNGDEALRGSP